jgi:hypothetical protein
MDVPVTGYLLIPLGLVITFLPWRYCFIGLTVFCMMSPAAVVNAGHFGLQPGYYLALLLIGRTAVEIMVDGFTLNSYVLSRMQPLFYFAIVCLVVLFVALCLFNGQFETMRGTTGFKTNLARPFHLDRENFTQLFYLFENTCVVYVIAHQGARLAFQKFLRDWDHAIVCAICFAAAISIWQFLSFYAGIYFPDDFFYSNAGYNRADSQEMAGLLRVNGPFEEPAALGYHFTGFLMFSWLRYRVFPTAFSVGLITACIFCMLVSTSTTAYFGGFLFGCVALFDIASQRLHLLTKDFKLSSGQIATIAVIVVSVVGGAYVVAANWDAIKLILKLAIFQKSDSTSFQERSGADDMAMNIIVQTYGIGLGLGSHKPNSLLLALLSNTGVIGTVVFGFWIFTLLRPRWGAASAQTLAWLKRVLAPFQWGVIGLVLISVFSNPNLSTMDFWIQMAGVFALLVSLHRSLATVRPEVRLPRVAAPPALGPIAQPGLKRQLT